MSLSPAGRSLRGFGSNGELSCVVVRTTLLCFVGRSSQNRDGRLNAKSSRDVDRGRDKGKERDRKREFRQAESAYLHMRIVGVLFPNIFSPRKGGTHIPEDPLVLANLSIREANFPAPIRILLFISIRPDFVHLPKPKRTSHKESHTTVDLYQF